MTKTIYTLVKDHFDRLFRGEYRTTGFENIIDVYSEAFDTKVHMFDICESKFSNAFYPLNPITKIITFVGSGDHDIKTGLVPCLNDMTSVSYINEDIMHDLNEDNISDYIMSVYAAIYNIVFMDKLYSTKATTVRNNPYCAFLTFCPLYFTYHHIKSVATNLVNCENAREAFGSILIRNICDEEDSNKIIDNLFNNKYYTDFEDIYRVMTCNNTIEPV